MVLDSQLTRLAPKLLDFEMWSFVHFWRQHFSITTVLLTILNSMRLFVWCFVDWQKSLSPVSSTVCLELAVPVDSLCGTWLASLGSYQSLHHHRLTLQIGQTIPDLQSQTHELHWTIAHPSLMCNCSLFGPSFSSLKLLGCLFAWLNPLLRLLLCSKLAHRTVRRLLSRYLRSSRIACLKFKF